MEKVNKVYLSLGSNIEDRMTHLKKALQKINETIGTVIKKSSVYESEALGFISQVPFYNMCIEIETNLPPDSLLKKTQEIEVEIGRTPKKTEHYESRKIDIDIIFYSDSIIETETLSIPHKNYANRKFVLLPLCELNSSIIEPIKGRKIIKILAGCTDYSDVKRISLNI